MKKSEIKNIEEQISFEKLYDLISKWQIETFLKDCKPPYDLSPLLNHLREEIDELEKEPLSQTEWADLFILLIGGYSRTYVGSGIDKAECLLEIIKRKMNKNLKRKWSKPDEKGIMRHIKK